MGVGHRELAQGRKRGALPSLQEDDKPVAEILEMGVNPNCLVMVLGSATVEITGVQLAPIWLISDSVQ